MGLCGDEDLSNEALIKEGYQGIRPAPGYPACPEHTVKADVLRSCNAARSAAIDRIVRDVPRRVGFGDLFCASRVEIF